MRNDTNAWAPATDAQNVLDLPNLTVSQIHLDRITLVSGVTAQSASQLTRVEWPGICADVSYVLSLRRDRILEINGPPRAWGWDNASGLAISDMTDGYAVFDIEGTAAHTLLKRGGFVDLHTASKSVARMMFGLPTLLYRCGRSTFRMHVTSAYAMALRTALNTHADGLTD